MIIAGDKEDAGYMLRKLKEQTQIWGLTMKMTKMEQLKIGDNEQGPKDMRNIKQCEEYK